MKSRLPPPPGWSCIIPVGRFGKRSHCLTETIGIFPPPLLRLSNLGDLRNLRTLCLTLTTKLKRTSPAHSTSIRLALTATFVVTWRQKTSCALSNTPIPLSVSSLRIKPSVPRAKKRLPAVRSRRSEMMVDASRGGEPAFPDLELEQIEFRLLD